MKITRPAGPLLGAALMITVCGLAGCTPGTTGPDPLPTGQAPTSAAASPSSAPTSAPPSPTFTEPTTTNTLPPPKAPTKPAASTAGKLNAKSLPVPAGWKTIVREGGSEEGYQGNGTWVHARDPRYAARDTINVGCADVTRDDYTDPKAALEGTYVDGDDHPGIGLVLDFAETSAAKAYFNLYRDQVKACDSDEDPLKATIVPSDSGLIDHRSYPGEDAWTEMALLKDKRLTLIILTDPGHKMTRGDAEKVLKQIAGA